MLVIVPESLSTAINQKLDAAFASVPDAAPDRRYFYEQLLSFYNEHGYLPEFTLTKTEPPNHREDGE